MLSPSHHFAAGKIGKGSAWWCVGDLPLSYIRSRCLAQNESAMASIHEPENHEDNVGALDPPGSPAETVSEMPSQLEDGPNMDAPYYQEGGDFGLKCMDISLDGTHDLVEDHSRMTCIFSEEKLQTLVDAAPKDKLRWVIFNFRS